MSSLWWNQLTDRRLTRWIIKTLDSLRAKYGHFLPRANFLQRIVRVTHHMLRSTDSPNDSPLIAPIYSSMTHSAAPSDKSTRPTRKLVFLKNPANVPPRSFKDALQVRPCRQHTSLPTRGHWRVTITKLPGWVGALSVCGLTVEWIGQRLRTSSRTRSRPAPPSREPCGHPGSGLTLELKKIPSPCNRVNNIKDVFGHEIISCA